MVPETVVGWLLLLCAAFVFGFGFAAGQNVFGRLFGPKSA
jgi:hypothetical protein